MSSVELEELLRRKQAAIEAEDFDEAKRMKEKIAQLRKLMEGDDDGADLGLPAPKTTLPPRRKGTNAPLLGHVGAGPPRGLRSAAPAAAAAAPAAAAAGAAKPASPTKKKPEPWAKQTDVSAWAFQGPMVHKGRGGGRPLIVLLGWAGARPQQLVAPVRFWQDLGCDVLRFTDGLWGAEMPSRGVAARESTYHNIRNSFMENRGFIVHAHSSLGAFTLSELITMDEKSGRELFVHGCRGVIFDCGPGIPTPQQLATERRFSARLIEQAAIMSAARAGKVLAPEVDAIWTPIYLLCLLVLAVVFRSSRTAALRRAWNRLTTSIPSDTPLMLLRAELDDAAREDGYAVAMADRNPVQCFEVEGVGHCQSLSAGPDLEKTKKRLVDFLDKCMEM